MWRIRVLRASISKNQADCDTKVHQICQFFDMLCWFIPKWHIQTFFENFQIFWPKMTFEILGKMFCFLFFWISNLIILICYNIYPCFWCLTILWVVLVHFEPKIATSKFSYWSKIWPKVASFQKKCLFWPSIVDDANILTWVFLAKNKVLFILIHLKWKKLC